MNQPVRATGVLEWVLLEHAREAAALWQQRDTLIRAPHITLRNLSWQDERIEAHLDGLRVAGAAGATMAHAQLETVGPGEVFSAAVLTLESRSTARLERLMSLGDVIPEAHRGLRAALGWTSPSVLRGFVKDLLASNAPQRFRLGIAGCTMHGYDPGPALRRGLEHQDASLRARSLRAVGELSARQYRSSVESILGQDTAPATRFWAAYSLLMLGERRQATGALRQMALAKDDERVRAFTLLLQVLDLTEGHALLTRLRRNAGDLRRLVQGSGIVGDPAYAPWLLQQMRDPAVARVAAEAFRLITGLDFSRGYEAAMPEGITSGPTDDPADADVSLDDDDGLPWPDVERVTAWWKQHCDRFPAGFRHFLGMPVTRNHCVSILRGAGQRERRLAAQYLCLLKPGTPLFNTSAPAWRQQRLLAQMT
jgi:uncharacterized protein (TIGR02270 family)